jgi:sn-glycerol 3-phosphate transport system permease protein
MEERAYFPGTRLALLLILPQMALVLTFFYWPAGAALYWAFTLEQPWGGGNQWVGLDNFAQIFADRQYWRSVLTTTGSSRASGTRRSTVPTPWR